MMITRLDKEIINRVRSGNVRIRETIKNKNFLEENIAESDRIEWKIYRGKEITDEEIIFWGRARRHKAEYWYPKHWKKNRKKMIRYRHKYDFFHTIRGIEH